MAESFLIVPELTRGEGAGHLIRSCQVAAGLSGTVHWLHGGETATRLSKKEAATITGKAEDWFSWVEVANGPYDKIVVDKRRCSEEEICRLRATGCSIGVDPGGAGRPFFHYCIDTLPSLSGLRPNVYDPGLLPLPENVRPEWPRVVQRVLVVLGGEDGGRAAMDLAEELVERPELPSVSVSAASSTVNAMGKVDTISAPGTLRERIHEFDLVVTYFGITAFEALWARVPVVLVDRSRYHRALSARAQLPTAHSTSSLVTAIARSALDATDLAKQCSVQRPRERRSLAETIASLCVPRNSQGVFGTLTDEVALLRLPEKTFFQSSSGLVSMLPFRDVNVTYDHDYFFREYRNQYGRTYVDDFSAIVETGKRRASDIKQVAENQQASGSTLRLLDVGCAYGAFLQAAKLRGWDVTGLDISSEAIDYVREVVGLDAFSLDVSSMTDGDHANLGTFDVVTMWYVIEHFPRLDILLGTIRRLLRPGGLLAFSTPNLAGVSGKRNRDSFLRKSPADHYTVWSSKSCAETLRHAGFTVRKVRSTGHHPERFWIGEKTNLPLVHTIVRSYSRLAGLGDTFEVVAEKAD